MKERLKQIRKDQKLTQTEFGEKLNLTKNYIYLLESGEKITDKVILAICKEFGVNETWLRTGDGEMYAPESLNQKKAKLISKIMDDETDPYLLNILCTIGDFNADQIQLVLDVARKILKEQDEE